MFKIFIIQDKRLLIYSMTIQELDLKPLTKQIKNPTGKGLKILTPKQLLQRLLAQVKAR